MRRRRAKKSKKGILIFCLMLTAALILGFALIQNFGLPNWQKPSGQAGPGNTTGIVAENSDVKGSTGETSSLDSAGRTSTAQNSGLPVGDGQQEQTDKIQDLIDSMTLEEKIGQLVIVGVDGYENDEHSRKLIEENHVGGFILFKNNIQNSRQMLDLLNSLKAINAAQNKIPLFLSVDEEGGRVSRMPDEFMKFPSNKEIGKLNDANLSYNVGRILGEELSAFGFNVDFAPVMDINSNPKNPVIGDRSFGTTPELVSKLGIETMKGIQSRNVISVIKHFPGHGDTDVDSHVGLPRVNNSLKRLKSFELKPFKAAIENNADAVMVAHILLPQIDAKNPASFSKTIISDILRTDLNFNGVVITDDFTMGAITQNYNIGEAAVKSINAGSDIVLVCHEFDKQKAVIDSLYNAAQTGQISIERIDRSIYRILKLKEKYKLSDENSGLISSSIINDQISALFGKNK